MTSSDTDTKVNRRDEESKGDASAERERGRPERLRRRRARIILAVLGIWTAALLLLFQLAREEVRSGESDIARLERRLTAQSILDDHTLESLKDASSSFRRANRYIDNPITAPIRLLPVLGRQLRSADALTASAELATTAARDTLGNARSLLGTRVPEGEGRIKLLNELTDLTGDARNRINRLRLGPSTALFQPLAEARSRFESGLEKLQDSFDRSVAFGEGMTEWLEGPRKYLIVAANNSEMRAGSGMYLGLGVLTTAGGEVSASAIEAPPTLAPGLGVRMDPDFEARWGWAEPNREWRNLALSPRFDASADLAVRMWKVMTGEELDGVIVVDIPALKAVLEATGPVEVEGQTINSENVQRLLLHEQYVGVPGTSEAHEARHERSGMIAAATLKKLAAGEWDPGVLVSKLGLAARGRHLMLWSKNPVEQRAWRAVGIDGSVEPNSLLVAVNNRGGNKLDQFLRIAATMDVEEEPGSQFVTLELNFTNDVSLDEPSYILGSKPPRGFGPGVYSGILSLSLPGEAFDAGFMDADLSVVGPDGSTMVIGTELSIPPGESTKMVATFRLPESQRWILVEPSARVPSISWQFGEMKWRDNVPRTVDLGKT